MSVSQFRYKAFISYSHADRKHAEWLLKALEAYKVPKSLIGRHTENGAIPARLSPIFRDRDELPAAHKLTDRLFQALRASEYLIVLCSPRSARSKLVNREIVEFKKTHGDGRVLCMIIEGTPFADNPEEECFPEALRHSFMADGKKAGLSAEGLAADLRPEGDGKRMALQKIIAGMLGVGLNDIVRRDEQRKNQKIMIIGVTAVLSIAVLSGLVYQAQHAKLEALKAQTLAIKHSKNLEFAQQKGEEVVSFLMTTVYRELEATGRINVLEDAAAKILDYYENQPTPSAAEDVVRYRAIALFRMGQTMDRTGNSNAADKVFDSALQQVRRAYEAAPENPTIIHRLQIALFFSGYLDHRMGRFEEALQKYEKRLEIAKTGATIDPERKAWQSNLQPFHSWEEQIAEAETFLGDLLAGPLAQTDRGIAFLESAFEKRQALLAELSWNKERATRLATSLQYLGRAYLRTGKLADAKNAFIQQKEIYERLANDDPNNFNMIRRQYIIERNLAAVKRDEGDIKAATNLFLKAAEGHESLASRDPNNVLWQANVARAYYQLAETYFMNGAIDSASGALEKARNWANQTIQKDSTRPNRRLVRYQIDLLGAEIANALEQREIAEKRLNALVEKLEQEDESFGLTNGAAVTIAKAMLLLAKLQESQDKAGLAFASRLQAQKALARHPNSAKAARLLAETNLLLGNNESSETLPKSIGQSKPDRDAAIATPSR